MFHLHGIRGHLFSGTLEQLRQQQRLAAVAPAARVRRVGGPGAPGEAAPDGGAVAASGDDRPAAAPARGLALQQAYGQAAAPRQPLRVVADVMHSPARTVPADATLGEAARLLAQHGIAQAPVLDGGGALVGLIGRAALPALAGAGAPDAAALARLALPVTAAMWSPVPSVAPDTALRRVAAVLLDTGLPGLPVADADGRVQGFVSRTDLLRALVHEPPLDLWS